MMIIFYRLLKIFFSIGKKGGDYPKTAAVWGITETENKTQRRVNTRIHQGFKARLGEIPSSDYPVWYQTAQNWLKTLNFQGVSSLVMFMKKTHILTVYERALRLRLRLFISRNTNCAGVAIQNFGDRR